MEPGDIVMFYKTLHTEKLTEGKLLRKLELTNLERERPYWSVEYGKRVKKSIMIHEKQIEGLKE